jgi:hypothetical protein
VNALLGDLERARQLGAAGRQAFRDELCYEIGFRSLLAALESAGGTTPCR